MTNESTAQRDPLDTPLPCDVVIGHITMRKGVPLRALVTRMEIMCRLARDSVLGESRAEMIRRGFDRTQALQAAEHGASLALVERATAEMQRMRRELEATRMQLDVANAELARLRRNGPAAANDDQACARGVA